MSKNIKKEKKRMSKKKKVIIIIVILILLIGILIGGYFYLKSKQKVEIPVKVIEVLDSIEGYDYKLEDRDTDVYKEKFLELKKVLESEEIDEKKYASLLAELFAIDLYTIDNKNSKYDVGSLDFIYQEEQEKFKNKVMDSMYKLVEDNTSNKRSQELPIVSNTEIEEIKEIDYTKSEIKLEGYEVILKLSYEKDLEYDTKVKITLVKEDQKIYVVSIIADKE